MEREVYLGDGCYASFDGWQIWLRAPRERGDHVIALEPLTLRALMDFAATVPANAPPIAAARAGADTPE